ncbi:MAG: hypothetical protein Unbinned338contig1000_18 [Prokaryotic dsDNA virus sp.]|nr:MAG: hypothetical protein Unbinned338contig1000_18 [Prokaryotic dsDNA virus sp.]|tara:strand:+ start:5576 stop:6028 length:453 start_codon:yes stop_codon:yes gene_type:complete
MTAGLARDASPEAAKGDTSPQLNPAGDASHPDLAGSFSVTFPWPAPGVRTNARGNRGKRAMLVKQARTSAAQIAWDAGLSPMSDVLPVKVTFHPPNARDDKLNRMGNVKAMFDGIADALGVNDKAFDPTPINGEQVQGGAVVVTFAEIPA